MFEDIFINTKDNDDNTTNVFSRLNREILRFLRNNMECSHVLVGRKELKEIRETIPPCTYEGTEDTSSTIIVKIIEVAEDSYFAGAYVPAKGEFQAKRLERLRKRQNSE